MLTSLFIAKWLFRIGHVLPVAAISGKVFFDLLVRGNPEPANGELGLEVALDVILIVSGFINMFLLKPKETFPTGLKPWKFAMYFKLIITIFFLTPFLTAVSSITRKQLNSL